LFMCVETHILTQQQQRESVCVCMSVCLCVRARACVYVCMCVCVCLNVYHMCMRDGGETRGREEEVGSSFRVSGTIDSPKQTCTHIQESNILRSSCRVLGNRNESVRDQKLVR